MPAMIDVNMDGTLSPGDALAVVNFLNAKSSFFASHAAGGEGESDVGGALNGASTSSDGVVPLDVLEPQASGGASSSQASSGAVLLERAGEDLWVVSTKDSARKTANGTNSR